MKPDLPSSFRGCVALCLMLWLTTASSQATNAVPQFIQLGSDLASAAPHADPNVIALATKALACANQSELVRNTRTLSVIDYSRPSTQRRLWVFDLAQRRLLFEELVAHGRNTGDDTAVRFSNTPSSLMSSIGVFLTGNAYIGHNGYSLQLRGLDPGFNDNAFDRAIVMHGAPYVDAALAISQGRIGRSFGCPAVRPAIARALIDTIRDGSLIVAYYPDQTWLRNSAFIRDCGETAAHAATFAKTIIAMTSRPAPSRTKLSFP